MASAPSGAIRSRALDPASEYFAGFRAGTGTLVRFRTFGRGAFSFTAAFGSCAGGTRVVPMSHVSNSGVFAAHRRPRSTRVHAHGRPALLQHHWPGPAGRAAGRAVPPRRSTACCRRSARRCSTAARRSSTCGTTTTTASTTPTRAPRPATRRAPTTPPTSPATRLPLAPNADGPIAQRFDIGRVRVPVTDARSERQHRRAHACSAPRQVAWLLGRARGGRPRAVPLLVWVNPVPWITSDGDSEGWGQFADERRRLGRAHHCARAGSRLLMLSGDAHMLAFDDGRNNAQRRLRRGPGGAARSLRAAARAGRIRMSPPVAAQRTVRHAAGGRRRRDADRAMQGHRYDGGGRSSLVPGRGQLRCGACARRAASLPRWRRRARLQGPELPRPRPA